MLEMPGAEARGLPCLSDDDLLGLGRELVRAGVRSSAPVHESPAAFFPVSSDPLPDGVPGALEGPSGSPDAVLIGVLHHSEPEIEDVVLGTDHVIVADGTHEHLRTAALVDRQSTVGASLCPPFYWSGVWDA